METRIIENSYGKGSVKLLKLNRQTNPHEIFDVEVDILLSGDLDEAFTNADNSKVLPTDTMKNIVYVLAKKESFSSIEEFGIKLASYFVTTYEQITSAEIEILQNAWENIRNPQMIHNSAFISPNKDNRYCRVEYSEFETYNVYSGIRDLTILKSANSGFENYFTDEHTTLKPTNDRIFATTLSATWMYREVIMDYNSLYTKLKNELLNSFAIHDSRSVQHTLYEMANYVLKKNPEISRIRLLMPNEHKILANLDNFGLENDNEIFIPASEPFGIIEAEIGSE